MKKNWSGALASVSEPHWIELSSTQVTSVINELPPNLDALVQHLQQQRTDITKLLPHSISVERFFIRKRLDADGIEMESKYRCDATRRLAADDNGWVEIPRCGVIVTGKDSYKRHLKSRHLGITRTPKASLNLSEWIKSM